MLSYRYQISIPRENQDSMYAFEFTIYKQTLAIMIG